MRIAFLAPTASQPRYQRRISGLQDAGASATCLHFNREYFSGGLHDVQSISLGPMEHGKYFRRLVTLARALPEVRKASRANDVLYAFSLDMALLGLLASLGLPRRPVVYEVGDVFALTDYGLFSRVARLVERLVIKRSSLVVTVTRRLVDEYFREVQGVAAEKVVVIENRMSAGVASEELRNRLPSVSPTLRIGYFGVIRDVPSWEALKHLVTASDGRVEVLIRGVIMGIPDHEDDIAQHDGMSYGGEYSNPEDLSELYGQIDIAWVAYTCEGGAQLPWAKANRFFEACGFARPMIVNVGSGDADDVERLDIGCIVDLDDLTFTTERVLAISADDLRRWHANLLDMPASEYEATDEHARLHERLRSIGMRPG